MKQLKIKCCCYGETQSRRYVSLNTQTHACARMHTHGTHTYINLQFYCISSMCISLTPSSTHVMKYYFTQNKSLYHTVQLCQRGINFHLETACIFNSWDWCDYFKISSILNEAEISKMIKLFPCLHCWLPEETWFYLVAVQISHLTHNALQTPHHHHHLQNNYWQTFLHFSIFIYVAWNAFSGRWRLLTLCWQCFFLTYWRLCLTQ